MNCFKKIPKHFIIIACCVLAAVLVITAILVCTGINKKPNPVLAESAVSVSSESEPVSEPDPEPIQELIITSPAKTDTTVTQSTILFSGSCDPNTELYINDSRVETNTEGVFSTDIDLKVGKNTFNVKYGDQLLVYTIRYRYILINGYSPSKAVTLDSGSTLVVRATARYGSNVTAVFQNKTVTLTQEYCDPNTPAPEFIGYFGSFDLPAGTERDTNMGKVTFTAVLNGMKESFSSGNVTLRKNPIVQNNGADVTPSGGNYINVGSGYVAEVVQDSIETFNGNTVDDYSRPTNNYLPKGTVDYCSVGTVVDPESGKEYRKLRCGKRVYTTSKIGNNITSYIGTLPETNNVSLDGVDEQGRYTTLTFNVDWKAPFNFELLPQEYVNPKYQDYRVPDITYKYIDITFCYAGTLDAALEFGADNPVFQSATVIKNQSDYTLRLFLKKTGAFYGWSAHYNSSNQLVFEFLHPVKVSETSANDYGVDLSNATVFIDVGHGGTDSGACSGKYKESELTLKLALKVKAQLELTGARVIINRTGDESISAQQRIEQVKAAKPDLVISIHRNANNSSKVSGYNTYYYHAYSKAANDAVYNCVSSAGLYTPTKYSFVDWHYFFLGRVSDCPVILTENGYMSNTAELSKIVSDNFNDQCAIATVKGIAKYFLSIQ